MTDSIDAHVSARYEIRERLGKGAYGIVWRALDKSNGEVVAVKKIFDAFRNITDAQRTFREIMYLQAFSDHTNIVTLVNVLKADNDKDFYLVFGHMDTDLHVVIRGKLLLDIHIRYIMHQVLLALACMHSGEVIHRDLKPSNILLNDDCDVRLCDFGLARSVAVHMSHGDEVDPTMTDYVATRWYRAPEILLGSHKYTTYADMWSVGCILGEMLAGKPLFTGSSSLNQVDVIMRCLGRPTPADLAAMQSPYAESTVSRMHIKPGATLDALLHGAPPDGVDLIKRLLAVNPMRRLSAVDALKHPYVAQFYNPKTVRLLSGPVHTPIDDNTRLTIEDYRVHLYKEVAARCEVIATHRNMAAARDRALQTPRIPTAQAEAGRPAVLAEKELAIAAHSRAKDKDRHAPAAEPAKRSESGHGPAYAAAAPAPAPGPGPAGSRTSIVGGTAAAAGSAVVTVKAATGPGARRDSVQSSVAVAVAKGASVTPAGSLPVSVTGRVGTTAAHAMRNTSHIFGAPSHFPVKASSVSSATPPSASIAAAAATAAGGPETGHSRHARPSGAWRAMPAGYGRTGPGDMAGNAFGNGSTTGARSNSHGYLTTTQYKELTKPW